MPGRLLLKHRHNTRRLSSIIGYEQIASQSYLLGLRLLDADGQDVAVDAELDVLLGHAGDVRLDLELVRPLRCGKPPRRSVNVFQSFLPFRGKSERDISSCTRDIWNRLEVREVQRTARARHAAPLKQDARLLKVILTSLYGMLSSCELLARLEMGNIRCTAFECQLGHASTATHLNDVKRDASHAGLAAAPVHLLLAESESAKEGCEELVVERRERHWLLKC